MRRSDLVQDHHDQTRQYELISQIIDYDNKDVEKLSLYAHHLQPMLRERLDTAFLSYVNRI